MAYCQGCGSYVGDLSAYRHNVPGKGEMVLCYRCKRWAERHPGRSRFPPRHSLPPTEGRRIRTFAILYTVSSLGLFAFGVFLLVSGNPLIYPILSILAALSLFLFGVGMRKYLEK